MKRFTGLRVHSHAGQATDVTELLLEPGGTQIASRRISPDDTASKCSQIASICQPGTNRSGIPIPSDHANCTNNLSDDDHSAACSIMFCPRCFRSSAASASASDSDESDDIRRSSPCSPE